MASKPVEVRKLLTSGDGLSQSPALSAQTISTIHDQESNGLTPLNTSWSWFLDKYIEMFNGFKGSTYISHLMCAV